jgi:hypothetical protein
MVIGSGPWARSPNVPIPHFLFGLSSVLSVLSVLSVVSVFPLEQPERANSSVPAAGGRERGALLT